MRTLKLADLQPGRTDRAVLCGVNGCGKTVLAKFLLQGFPALPTYVIDWKGEIRWPGYARYTKFRQFYNSEKLKRIYAPNIHEIDNANYWDAFFCFAYRRKNCQVYVDEVSAVTRRSDLPPYYRHLIARGRERGIRLLSSTQRPVEIPQIIISEAAHVFCFRLNRDGDRERVEKNTGLSREKIAALKRNDHQFYYVSEDETFGPLHLTIRTEGG